MIDVRCPLCKNRYSCARMGMIPFEHCGMFVIDDTIKRHKTNADRIRSMSDEELARWLNCMQSNAYNRGMLKAKVTAYPNCNVAWLDWLKQSAKEGEGEDE